MKQPACILLIFFFLSGLWSGDSEHHSSFIAKKNLAAEENKQAHLTQFGYEPGKDINQKDELGRAPLHYVALTSNLQALQFLIKQGARLEIRDNEGSTPLHWAIGNKNLIVAQYIIDQGANVNARDRYGNTPLHKAAHYGSIGVVKFLVSRGANMQLRTKKTYSYDRLVIPAGSTPLTVARIANRPGMVKFLTILEKQWYPSSSRWPGT